MHPNTFLVTWRGCGGGDIIINTIVLSPQTPSGKGTWDQIPDGKDTCLKGRAPPREQAECPMTLCSMPDHLVLPTENKGVTSKGRGWVSTAPGDISSAITSGQHLTPEFKKETSRSLYLGRIYLDNKRVTHLPLHHHHIPPPAQTDTHTYDSEI